MRVGGEGRGAGEIVFRVVRRFAMIETLHQKIRRMRQACQGLIDPHVSTRTIVRPIDGGKLSVETRFGLEGNADQQANAAFALVASIGSLGDHLDKWCKHHGRPKRRQALLRESREAALIQDLWNYDKHGDYGTFATWSGQRPRLVDVSTALRVHAGSQVQIPFSLDPRAGVGVVESVKGSPPELILSGRIVNESGAEIGEFFETCSVAISAWEREYVAAGIALP